MLDALTSWAWARMPDMLIYAGIALVTMVAILKCCAPVSRNAHALRRATRRILADAKQQKTAQPAWNNVRFLGAPLQNEWAAFLQNAEQLDAHGDSCDVEQYINADTAIYNAGSTSLADLAPGVLVSLGILGTFLGITKGLSGLTLNDSVTIASSIQTLIGGMSVAFLTSICGIVASMVFNFINRYTIGRALRALNRFVEVFQQYAMPRPIDADVKMLLMQQQQTDYLRTFVEEVSLRTATQMEQAILRALLPVQRSMDNFIVAATREQVEGIDRVAARFVERMNLALDGQFKQLGATLDKVNLSQQHAQADLQAAAAAISAVTQDVVALGQQTQTTLDAMQQAIGRVSGAHEQAGQAGQAGQASAELLARMHQAAQEQAEYLGQLQTYQQQFLERTGDTNQALGKVADNMQAALDSLNQGIGTMTKEFDASVKGISAAVKEVPDMMHTSAKKYGAQVEQFVAALAQLQKTMQNFAQAVDKQREVG